MTEITLKQVSSQIRDRLAHAAARDQLPGARYVVRASNSKKTGPAVNIEIQSYESLIPDIEDDGAVKRWQDTAGTELIEAVDKIAGRDRYVKNGSPAVGGTTRFGICIISVRPTTVTHDGSRPSRPDNGQARYCGNCHAEITWGEWTEAIGTDGPVFFCGDCAKTEMLFPL